MTSPHAPAAPPVALPGPRGPWSAAVLEALRGGAVEVPGTVGDALGEDVQLALALLYELHYRDLPGAVPGLEWDPDLLRLRAALEGPFLLALRALGSGGADVDAALAPLLREPVRGTGPSWHLAADGTREQLREYVLHRSHYHLKEADPQAFVVPRLEGAVKAAVVTVQHDEYGGGRPERMHAALFAAAMRELDLSTASGVYLDRLPATTLAPVNAMSLFALHRSLRGAAVGQFVMVEVTSSPGSRRLAAAFDRVLGPGSAGAAFYDEHVEADAVHEQLLRAGLRAMLEAEPALAADVVLGVEAGLALEERFGEALLQRWSGVPA